MYRKLAEYEQKIDAMVQRKKMQVKSVLYKPLNVLYCSLSWLNEVATKDFEDIHLKFGP
jgi:hypothetical protein